MGAKFGKTANQVSLGIENAMYNDWEKWSRELVFDQTARAAAFEGNVVRQEEDLLRNDVLDEEAPQRPQGAKRSLIGNSVFEQQAKADAQTNRAPS